MHQDCNSNVAECKSKLCVYETCMLRMHRLHIIRVSINIVYMYRIDEAASTAAHTVHFGDALERSIRCTDR